MIQYYFYPTLKKNFLSGKMVLLQGPKGIGKESVVTQICNELGKSYCILDLSKKSNRKIFSEINQDVFSDSKFNVDSIIILEGQYISNMTSLLELAFADGIKQQITILFSYTLSLDPKVLKVLEENEYLFNISPLTFYEIANESSVFEAEKLLEERILFGSFPAVINSKNPEIILKSLIDQSLKTIFSNNERVNKLNLFRKVLQIVAMNIGEPLSFYEIGQICDLDNETVERYIELMINAQLLIKIPCYHNENRYELKKSNVFYFLDNGIRNAFLNNFNPLDIRSDAENLWRNWLVAEKIKWQKLNGLHSQFFFWQSHTSQRIDILEFNNQGVEAFRTSLQKKYLKEPPLFKKYYPTIPVHTINRNTFLSFLTTK
jgi:predicted AAA+ superfamily ATPase